MFLVHGLDRMFEKPELPIEPPVRGVVSQAFMGVPEGKQLYRERLTDFAGRLLQAEWITNRTEQVIRLLEPIEPELTPRARALQERILRRVQFVRKSLQEGRWDAKATK